jgi:hypothetical protein
MKKINLILLFIFTITFISAYDYVGRLSVSGFFDNIEPSNLVLPVLFIIFFAIINFSLLKVFKGNKATAGVSAFAVSLLLVYGINRTGFDFTGIFYNIGIPTGLIGIIITLLLLVGVIFLINKIHFSGFFMLFGALFFLASFTDLIYESLLLGFIGAVMFIIGLVLKLKAHKKLGGVVGTGISKGLGTVGRGIKSGFRTAKQNYNSPSPQIQLKYKEQQQEAINKEQAIKTYKYQKQLIEQINSLEKSLRNIPVSERANIESKIRDLYNKLKKSGYKG